MTDRLFVAMSSQRLAEEISRARQRVILAVPGIHEIVAQALVGAVDRLGQEAVTVVLDCDGEVCRMGYGSIEAIQLLKGIGFPIRQSPGLRFGVLICDDRAWNFAPAVQCVEAETHRNDRPNGVACTPEQVEALIMAICPPDPQPGEEEPQPEIGSRPLSEFEIKRTEKDLQERPPQQFDLARIVRVYQSYFQYVEVHLEGCAITRRQVQLPPSLLNLTDDKDLEARLRTTYNLIEKDSAISGREIRKKLDDLLNASAPSLGKPWGRVLLKAKKADFEKEITKLRQDIEAHKKKVEAEVGGHINQSIERIAKAWVKSVMASPPAELKFRVPGEITEEVALNWLKDELAQVFPSLEDILKKMELQVHFSDVTYETLNAEKFFEALKKKFKHIDWNKPFEEFDAAQAKDQG
jgi:hypothetical protein